MNVVQSARSWDEQAALYAKGRLFQDGRWTIQDAGQVVTNAKPGSSFHNFGLALDCAWAGRDPYLAALTKGERNALWEDFGRIGKSYGFTWGGDFKLLNGVRDLPHLELSYGLSLSQCQELYEIGQLPAVWAFLDKQRGEPEGEGWITSRS
jgi:peptidoglycan L-alanyl-D-glutamate endopeptidase CwlK